MWIQFDCKWVHDWNLCLLKFQARFRQAQIFIGWDSRSQKTKTTGWFFFHYVQVKKIWKSRFYNTGQKIAINKMFGKSLLMCSCSTCNANNSTNDKLDALHRKQLRQCLNVHCHKYIKTEERYRKTNHSNVWDEFADRNWYTWAIY